MTKFLTIKKYDQKVWLHFAYVNPLSIPLTMKEAKELISDLEAALASETNERPNAKSTKNLEKSKGSDQWADAGKKESKDSISQ